MARKKTSAMRANGSSKTDRPRGSNEEYREGLSKINWGKEAKKIIEEQGEDYIEEARRRV